MSRQYWVVTRPKRKLIVVPDLLKIFSAVCAGKSWKGNRELQKEFERELSALQWKALNESKDGSGARTYASLLQMLGLWFEDQNGVQLTNAGQEIVDENPPVPILTKQLMDYQYPSVYSRGAFVDVDEKFQVHPHRFVIRLLLEGGLDEISQDEIGFCLAPFAVKDTDLDKCKKLILDYRQDPDRVISQAMAESGTSRDNLRNIGNTLVNNLEYTGWFEGGDDIKSLRLKDSKREAARASVEAAKEGLIQVTNDHAAFQMRYGSGTNVTKDYRYTSSERPNIDPNERAALLAYYEIAITKPIEGITSELITEISELRGIPESIVDRALARLAEKPVLERFEEQYLKLSVGSRESATDFEIRTNGIFSKDGFGFASEWVGPKPRHPDIIVYFDKLRKKHGIIDTKAYSEYTLPLDHKNLMAHTYIPNFRKLVVDGEEYDLAFYCYIAGGFGSGMSRSFAELTRMTDVPGSYITAANLLKLLRSHRRSPIDAKPFSNIFSMNSEIKDEDLELETV